VKLTKSLIMQSLKPFFIFFYLTILISCNSPHDQMVKTMSQQKFCLDKEMTEKDSSVKIGNGFLILNDDNTFKITNDSTAYSNLTGKWDLCCRDSDFGNYVFEVDGLPEWKQANTDLFVLVNGKKVRLFFTICK